MRRLFITLSTLLLLLVALLSIISSPTKPLFVDAWGCEGHALVSAVAHQWLLTNVRSRQFRDIVYTFFNPVTDRALSYDGYPFPNLFQNNNNNNNKHRYQPPVRTSFATLGCLADDLRSSSNPKWTSRSNWHFADGHCFPVDSKSKCPPTKESHKNEGGQLVPALEKVIAKLTNLTKMGALASGTPEAAENFAYLLHLVADAHQPLHSCSAAGRQFRKFYSEKKLKELQQEAAIAEEFGDYDDDENEVEIEDENSLNKKELGATTKTVRVEPTDRGGNFWCIDGAKKESGDNNKKRKRHCKKSLHGFFDSIAGFGSDFRGIVNGTGGGAGDCLGCEDSADVECCLNEPSNALMEYAFENGDQAYFKKLKTAWLEPSFWIEELEETCRATKFDKIRDVSSSSPPVWNDGEPLVPGETLSEEYEAWARDLLKKRIVLAGFRLGYLMRDLFRDRAEGDFPSWKP